MNWRTVVDRGLEATIVPSFTRIGPAVRSRLDHWAPPVTADLTGRVMVVTGATSGLGRWAAEALARGGATVVVWGRDAERTAQTAAEVRSSTGNDRVEHVVADTGDLAAVRRGAAELLQRHPVVHVLVHNAGALTADRRTAPDGTEQTVASQVVGPFLLTELLLPALRAARPGRVLTMSSGGMYSAGLTVSRLEMGDDYRGAEQYARAKRAQVTLNEMWAERIPASEVVFHAVHPGWADTPGVSASLPTFRRIMGPLLRTPEQGADTLVWLAADDGDSVRTSGVFWLDRRPRAIHLLRSTRRSDTPERRAELWQWCAERAGVGDDPHR